MSEIMEEEIREPTLTYVAKLEAEVARLKPYVDAFRREETRADKLGRELDALRAHLQEMVDMVAPTLKSEHRLSHGLSSALIRSRQILASEQDK